MLMNRLSMLSVSQTKQEPVVLPALLQCIRCFAVMHQLISIEVKKLTSAISGSFSYMCSGWKAFLTLICWHPPCDSNQGHEAEEDSHTTSSRTQLQQSHTQASPFPAMESRKRQFSTHKCLKQVSNSCLISTALL